jgi:hypothetical protein
VVLLGRLQAVLQATVGNDLSFDPLSFGQDSRAAPAVDVGAQAVAGQILELTGNVAFLDVRCDGRIVCGARNDPFAESGRSAAWSSGDFSCSFQGVDPLLAIPGTEVISTAPVSAEKSGERR